MTLTDQITEACKVPKGLTVAEMAAQLNKRASIINGMVIWMADRNKLFKSGVKRHYRYFTEKEHADAWALVAVDAYIALRKANKEATRLAKNAEYHRTKAEKRTAAVLPKATPVPLQEPKPAPSKVAPKPAKVIWPEHVSVQVIPTPPSRFAFQPHEGWRGQITADWMDRRSQGAGA